MLREYLSNIANAIRSKLGTTDKVNAQEFADKVNEVYDKGRNDEWSDFWDTLQAKGKRTNYYYAFGTDVEPAPFNDNNFKPKYDMRPTKAGRMFKINNITDIKGILEKQGVVLDFSNCDDVNFAFQNSNKNTRLPELNFSKCTSLLLPFTYNGKLVSIDKLILSDSGTTIFSDTFIYNSSLKDIVFEGVIGTSISFAWSPLSVESMKSVITHLANYKGTTKEATYKVTFKSDRWEALEASGKPFDDGLTTDETMTWQNYVTEVLGWNI